MNAEIVVWTCPNSSRDEVVGWHDGMLKVATKATAEKGKANKAIANLLKKKVGKSVSLVSGGRSKIKKFRFEDISNNKLNSLLDGIIQERIHAKDVLMRWPIGTVVYRVEDKNNIYRVTHQYPGNTILHTTGTYKLCPVIDLKRGTVSYWSCLTLAEEQAEEDFRPFTRLERIVLGILVEEEDATKT